MRVTHYLPLLAFVATLVPAAAACSQAVTPQAQILQPIDESKRISLKGNTLPVANNENDRGQVSPRLPMTDLILVLSRSPQQQAALEKFVASQYDPASPNFHRWLSADEVGQDFGPAQSDIDTISNWLSTHGFSIGPLPRDHMSIRFSGTAAEVESCFHTEIHNLEVKGVRHIGNMSDPEIPEALAPAVVGVKSLHNFFPRSLHRIGSRVTKDAATGKWKRPAVAQPGSASDHAAAGRTAARSEFGISVPASSGSAAFQVEDVTPYDFAAIYDILPLWTASTPIDGTGQTIAIAGTSSILMSDVNTFRTSFGLPAYTAANQPTLISGNSQPVTVCSSSTTNCSNDDLVENSLDVEWSGAIAKGANIVLVSSYPASSTDDGLYDSESYIVNNQTASIMNVSYGLCELFNTTSGNVQYYNLWQTASTEGIAVFVSAGDAGSAECDFNGDSIGNPYSAQFGLAVNGIASTPFNTAVGGTDFNWCPLTSTTPCATAPYWNSTNAASTGASANGYIPEVPWNDTCANPLALAFLQQQAASLNAPTFTTPEGACNFVYNSGGTTGALALFVDTVGGGGGASNCVVNDGNDVSSCDTSTVTTGSTNGSITLVADGWPKPSWQTGVSGIPTTDGVRDIPDVSFFASDGFLSSSSYLICVSALADCTYSDTAEPTALEVGGTSVSSPAMAGVMALINQKAGQSQGSPNAELYKLAAAETYSSCSAEKVTSTGTSCLFNDIDINTNAVPCDFGAEEGSPAQTGIQSPGCTPSTSGDLIGILPGFSAGPGYDQATGLGSLNVSNVVSAWPASASTGKATVTLTPASSSLVASNPLSVVVTVANSSSGGSTPTGKVTLIGGGAYSSGAQNLASGTYTFNVPANALPAGSDVFTVSYSGDSTYAAATGSATVAVTATAGAGTGTGTATANVTVTPTPTSLAVSSTLSVAVSVAAATSGGATPSGTVTLSGGGYTSSAGTLSTGTFTFSVPANSLAAGTDTLTVTYSGDSTYATSTGTAKVTVTAATAATGTFAISATSPTAVTAGSSASSTITVTASGSYAGTASLTCALTTSPTSAVDPPTCTLSPTSVTLSTSSTSGTVTASIATTAASTTTPVTGLARLRGKGTGWMGGSAVLALLVFFGVPARRRLWRSALGALAVAAVIATLSGCGDFWQAPSGGTSGGTTSGTYTFTVTGSGSPAVTAPTTTFTLTVNN